jgi:hypothetical protein
MTQDFIRERQYLKAVSPKTIIWYGCSFKAFEGALESKEAEGFASSNSASGTSLQLPSTATSVASMRISRGFMKSTARIW